MSVHYLLIAVFMLVEGYYSGSETGAYCLNKIRLRFRAEQGVRSALILQKLLTDPQGLICTTLIGTNIAVYISTGILTNKLELMGVGAAELVSTLCLAPVLLILAEATPKNIFQLRADFLMYKLAPSLAFFRRLFGPGVWVLKKISRAFSSRTAAYDRGAIFTHGRFSWSFLKAPDTEVMRVPGMHVKVSIFAIPEAPSRASLAAAPKASAGSPS